jgi:hypothetical protein
VSSFVRLSLEVTQQGNKTGTSHEVTAARDIVRKNRLDTVILLGSIGATAAFLAFEAVAFANLRDTRHTAVYHRGLPNSVRRFCVPTFP